MSKGPQFAKVDDDRRLVFGIASMAIKADGAVVTDLQGDQIPAGEIEDAQYDYVKRSRKGRTMHAKANTSELVESFVATPEKLAAMLKGLGVEVDGSGKADLSTFKGVAVWTGFKVNEDETWDRVKSGELRAFSIGGAARKEAA